MRGGKKSTVRDDLLPPCNSAGERSVVDADYAPSSALTLAAARSFFAASARRSLLRC